MGAKRALDKDGFLEEILRFGVAEFWISNAILKGSREEQLVFLNLVYLGADRFLPFHCWLAQR